MLDHPSTLGKEKPMKVYDLDTLRVEDFLDELDTAEMMKIRDKGKKVMIN